MKGNHWIWLPPRRFAPPLLFQEGSRNLKLDPYLNQHASAPGLSEMVKKIAETGGGSAAALQFIRDEDKKTARRERHAYLLGGALTFGCGIGLTIFLRGVVKEEPVYLAGLIPILVGIALVVYAAASAPRD